MKPLYCPSGKAKEYGDWAVNIYTGCPHHCFYCYAPNVRHLTREKFHTDVQARPNIAAELKKQIEREGVRDQLIHLCFTCDPYPTGYDTTATREVIQVIKETGNHVQILTKGDGSRDFDLLDGGDWYGITVTGAGYTGKADEEPGTGLTANRFDKLIQAKKLGIKTWISFEPVLDRSAVLFYINWAAEVGIDKVKIGKLNYHPSTIDWPAFGREAEALCQKLGLDYYIKESLRADMERGRE